MLYVGESSETPQAAASPGWGVVAWFRTDTRTEMQELLAAVLVDGAWSTPERLAVADYGRGRGLRVASDPDGNAPVVWHDTTRLWASGRAATAAAWSDPQSFHAPGELGGLDLGVDRSRRVTAVCSQGRDANARVWASRTTLP
jgi:hypothetical protein